LPPCPNVDDDDWDVVAVADLDTDLVATEPLPGRELFQSGPKAAFDLEGMDQTVR
jgi:hypothetical protein